MLENVKKLIFLSFSILSAACYKFRAKLKNGCYGIATGKLESTTHVFDFGVN